MVESLFNGRFRPHRRWAVTHTGSSLRFSSAVAVLFRGSRRLLTRSACAYNARPVIRSGWRFPVFHLPAIVSCRDILGAGAWLVSLVPGRVSSPAVCGAHRLYSATERRVGQTFLLPTPPPFFRLTPPVGTSPRVWQPSTRLIGFASLPGDLMNSNSRSLSLPPVFRRRLSRCRCRLRVLRLLDQLIDASKQTADRFHLVSPSRLSLSEAP